MSNGTARQAEPQLQVLIVDDDRAVSRLLQTALAPHRCDAAYSGPQALQRVRDESFDVVVLDLRLPGMDGLAVLRALRDRRIETEVVMLTGDASIDSAVAAMKLGAYDYLQKPFDIAALVEVVHRAAELGRRRRGHPRDAAAEDKGAGHAAALIGVDPKILGLRAVIERVAPTTATVLITGETGTGKDLVARMMHAGSRRAHGPFVVVDCPSVPVSLFESEVFGHERGAFTGAVARRRGKLQEADGGTLFLDEVGELTPEVQPKLLRFLQERQVSSVGANRVIDIDTRVVCATNRDLAAMVKEGTFRADLFHRLGVVQLDLPPLRHRRGDIPLLVAHFVDWFCRDLGVPGKVVAPESQPLLLAYDWPGNVRELENVIQQACILTEGQVITPESLPPRIYGAEAVSDIGTDSLADVSNQHILEVLRREAGNVSRAARALGVHRATLYRKLMALGVRSQRLGDQAASD